MSSTAQGALALAGRDVEMSEGVSDEATIAEGDLVEYEDTGMPPLLFMSRRADLRLTMVARYPMTGVAGQKVGETKGKSISFSDHRLVVPREGTMTITDMLGAGQWEATADEIADYLRGHRLKGDHFEGFWEVDPVAPAPSEDEMDKLQDAAMRLDEDALVEMIRREEKGWGREVVLRVARKTLSKVRTVKEEVAAEAAAAVALEPDIPTGAQPAETPAEPTTEAPVAPAPADIAPAAFAQPESTNAVADPAPADDAPAAE